MSTITEDEERGLRLHKLLDESLNTLREYLTAPYKTGPLTFQDVLRKEEKNLRSKLLPYQVEIVYPNGAVESDPTTYDASLLAALLRFVRKIPKPKTGWHNPPLNTDKSDSAHIVRIQLSRNKLMHNRLKKTDVEYHDFLNDIGNSMVALGCDLKFVKKIINMPLDNNTSALLKLKEKDLEKSNEKVLELAKALLDFETPFKGGISFGVVSLIPSFTGRKLDVVKLHSMLSSDSRIPTVITGLPGTGKTSLALFYCYEYSESYDNNIIWLNANGIEALKTSVAGLARHLKLLDHEQSFDVKLLLAEIFDKFLDRKILFVFDNADEHETILDVLPKSFSSPASNSTILITSRLSKWGQRVNEMSLTTLTKEESTELIRNYLPKELIEDNDNLNELYELLEGFPLALQQSINFMKHHVITTKEYIKKFKEQQQAHRLLSFASDDVMYKHNFYSAIMMTLNSLEQCENNIVNDLMGILSFMDGLKIEKQLFNLFDCYSIEDIEDAMKSLEQFSLIQIHRNYLTRECYITVHGLVQRVVRELSKILAKSDQFLEVLFNAFQCIIDEKENVEHVNFGSLWLHHIIQIFHTSKDDIVVRKFLARLKYYFAAALTNVGNDDIALDFLQCIIQDQHEPNQTTFDTLKLILLSLINLRKWREALDICFQMKEITSAIPGTKLSNATDVQHHIAFCYSRLGRNEEALNAYEDLRLKEKTPIFNQSKLTTDINIAMEYYYLANNERALAVIDNAIQLYGKSHPTKAVVYFLAHRNKSIFLIRLGKHEEAIDMLHNLLPECIKTLGDHHQETLNVYNCLANALKSFGKIEEALNLLLEIKEKRKQLGNDFNHHSLLNRIDIAECFCLKGNYSLAIKEYSDILKVRIELHGEDHTDVRHTKLELAKTYYFKGNYRKALHLYMDVKETLTKYEFVDNCIANCLLQLGEYKEAYELYVKVEKLSACRKSIANLTHKLNIGICLQHMGHYKEAHVIYDNVYQQYLVTHGEVKPETVIPKFRFASCLVDCSKYQDAIHLLITITDSKCYQPDDIYKLRAYYELARSYFYLGKTKEAIDNINEVLRIGSELEECHVLKVKSKILHAECLLINDLEKNEIEQVYDTLTKAMQNASELGDSHPLLLLAKVIVSKTLFKREKISEGLEILRDVRSLQTSVLGPDHPHTLKTLYNIAMFSLDIQERKRKLEEILKLQREILGELQYDTIETEKQIANCFHQEGKHEKALNLYKNLLVKQESVLGKLHRETIQTQESYDFCLTHVSNKNKCRIM
ncbi:uncharacterized protein LOC130629023 [Hydractinia symbiolongicarpus]|uniref:uncharacterized protein LOC130629023 n=1 Tax=Hydractinia symbiolongicarpus TaxID=13093 RepID=UPI00254FD2BD|nr:uncharacterized protein LOC130629023 [Hydractinia symbiolongicarpus]